MSYVLAREQIPSHFNIPRLYYPFRALSIRAFIFVSGMSSQNLKRFYRKYKNQTPFPFESSIEMLVHKNQYVSQARHFRILVLAIFDYSEGMQEDFASAKEKSCAKNKARKAEPVVSKELGVCRNLMEKEREREGSTCGGKKEREGQKERESEERTSWYVRAWSQSPRADPAKLFKFKFEISPRVANILFVSFARRTCASSLTVYSYVRERAEFADPVDFFSLDYSAKSCVNAICPAISWLSIFSGF